jgi:hypothetical protein
MDGASSMCGGEVRDIQGFGGKPEGKRQLGSPMHRWEDNIKMDLQEMGWGGIDWIDVAQDSDRCRALVNAVINFWVPLNARNFLTS